MMQKTIRRDHLRGAGQATLSPPPLPHEVELCAPPVLTNPQLPGTKANESQSAESFDDCDWKLSLTAVALVGVALTAIGGLTFAVWRQIDSARPVASVVAALPDEQPVEKIAATQIPHPVEPTVAVKFLDVDAIAAGYEPAVAVTTAIAAPVVSGDFAPVDPEEFAAESSMDRLPSEPIQSPLAIGESLADLLVAFADTSPGMPPADEPNLEAVAVVLATDEPSCWGEPDENRKSEAAPELTVCEDGSCPAPELSLIHI